MQLSLTLITSLIALLSLTEARRGGFSYSRSSSSYRPLFSGGKSHGSSHGVILPVGAAPTSGLTVTKSYWCNLPVIAPAAGQNKSEPWAAGQLRTIYFRWMNSWPTNLTTEYWFNGPFEKRSLIMHNTAGGSDFFFMKGQDYQMSMYQAEKKESPAGFFTRMLGNPQCIYPVPVDGMSWIKFDVTMPVNTTAGQYQLGIVKTGVMSQFSQWQPESMGPIFEVSA